MNMDSPVINTGPGITEIHQEAMDLVAELRAEAERLRSEVEQLQSEAQRWLSEIQQHAEAAQQALQQPL